MSNDIQTALPTVIAQPLISFGREICGELDAAVRREWLVTNGLGGYASGTVAGIGSRRYHGLLVAALEPPVGRTVLVGGTVEWLLYDGQRYPLSTHEYVDGTIDPHGYVHLESFRLEGTLPVWTYAVADVVLERRVWMEHGSNTTLISFTVLQASLDVELEVSPLVTYRDFHSLTSGQGWSLDVASEEKSVTLMAYPGAQPFSITADRGVYTPDGGWYWSFLRRAERERGLDDREDLYATGAFSATLAVGDTFSLRFSIDDPRVFDAHGSLSTERARQQAVLEQAQVEASDAVVQQLVLAADQFVVERYSDGRPSGKTVIAGYHWFNDWGRDTMIALPGLTLATGRASDAGGILRTFAGYVSNGMLPNNFPDHAGAIPGYNTADATLWYVLAARAYYLHSGDAALVRDLMPVLLEIVDSHISGTRYGIGVDPTDNLLHAGEQGVQLTWMDAKVGDWVVTPRIGKPVEINALWFNALHAIAELLDCVDPGRSQVLRDMASNVQSAFQTRFLDPQRGYLADVVDGPDGDDWSFRPNQVFAVSLPYPLLDGEQARALLDIVGRKLLTDFGLRSLAPDDADYHPAYGGGPLERDGGYHQGPVWSWLAGPFAEAHYRVHGDADAALAYLKPLVHHLSDAGLGSISEILEGGAPHHPRGCIAQAWSVAETLRVWRMLSEKQ